MDALTGPVAEAYAGALHAVAVADRALSGAESARLDQLLEARCPGVDREALFFARVSPEAFAAAVKAHAPGARVAIGQAYITDAVAIATADGELGGAEATVIIRCGRCLGLTQAEVGAVTHALDPWLGGLA